MQGKWLRKCNNCGTSVEYSWIHDAHDPHPYGNFVEKGTENYIDECPKCHNKLSHETTSPVRAKKKKPRKK